MQVIGSTPNMAGAISHTARNHPPSLLLSPLAHALRAGTSPPATGRVGVVLLLQKPGRRLVISTRSELLEYLGVSGGF